MKVILMRDLVHTGTRGEVVDVKPGFARNFLLPNGSALEATPGNMKFFNQQRKKIDAHHDSLREQATHLAAQLAELRIEIAKRVAESESLYGSVTATEIAEAVAAKGIEVDRRRIDLEGGIKSLGEHPVRINLHPEVIAELIVNVVAEE